MKKTLQHIVLIVGFKIDIKNWSLHLDVNVNMQNNPTHLFEFSFNQVWKFVGDNLSQWF